jgi:putative transposase
MDAGSNLEVHGLRQRELVGNDQGVRSWFLNSISSYDKHPPMARPLRIEYPGALYHVTSRGNARQRIFQGDRDRILFLDTLKKVAERYHWLCHAYCLMDNHYHLVIETLEGNLAKGMRQLNGVYTQAYNRRHARSGHIFQGRYKAILVERESHLLEVCRYVVLNPVRAKVVKEPGRWKWSSYRGTAGRESPHGCLTSDWVLSQFGTRLEKAQAQYREFVRGGIGGDRIHDSVKGQSLLGEEEFVQRLIGYVRGYEEIREIPRAQRYLHRPPLKDLFKARVRQNKPRRDKKIGEAVERYGYSEREVADYLKLHYSTISKILSSPKTKT